MPEHGFYFFANSTETRALSHKTKFLYFIEITPGTTASKQHEIVALKTGIQYGFFFKNAVRNKLCYFIKL